MNLIDIKHQIDNIIMYERIISKIESLKQEHKALHADPEVKKP